jgi:hypothetical protein
MVEVAVNITVQPCVQLTNLLGVLAALLTLSQATVVGGIACMSVPVDLQHEDRNEVVAVDSNINVQ